MRRLKWVFAAMFVPELGVFTAWQQWRWARRISRELDKVKFELQNQSSGIAQPPETLNNASAQPCQETSVSSKLSIATLTMNTKQSDVESNHVLPKLFSLIYGSYVVMGRLTVDVSDMHDSFTRLTLTAAGALHLAKLRHFKEIFDREIRDKSKADILGKGLVVFQVTWMIIQCISRKVAGYPLTALEVHTLVHATCALIMYTLWFRKPLDIQESTLVTAVGVKKKTTPMLLRTPGLTLKLYRNLQCRLF